MPPRRGRNSLSAPLEDISHLTLPEIRDRIERNNRVLSSSLFSPNPISPVASPNTSPNIPVAGPSRGGTASLSSSPADPVREKLLMARDLLLSRERELVLAETGEKLNGLDLTEVPAPRRTSLAGGMSGKQRALDRIQAAEERFASNGLILPMAETFALADRDFTASAANQLGNLSLGITHTQSSSPKSRSKKRDPYPDKPTRPRVFHEGDEISRAEHLARMNAFMGFKGDPDDDDEEDGVDEMFDMDPQEGEYAGEGDRMEIPGPRRGIRERGTGEEVDEFGEDDEEWAEGNDEYPGDGYGSVQGAGMR